MTRRIAMTGCSGGGKSTLLDEFARRGLATVEEPGRRIVREEQSTGGSALPWVDPQAFAKRAVLMAKDDFEKAQGTIIFDRSLLDALIWYKRSGTPLPERFEGLERTHRYDDQVLVTPPWPEKYATDEERQLPFDEARSEYDAILHHLPEMGYEPSILPKIPVAERADAALSALGLKVN